MILSIPGASIWCERFGSGMPLLCLHGGMGIDSASLRVSGITGLSSRGIDVLLYDQRGHGRSSASEERKYTHAVWANDARLISQQLGWPRFAMLGHSYGGFIALEYAVRWPDTLSHLVLIATSAGPLAVSPVRFASDEDLRADFRREWPLLFAGADKHWDLFDSLAFSAAPFNAAFNRELPQYDLRSKVHALNMPALLVVGSRDRYLPHMERLADAMPGARLHVIQDAGHFPFVEAEKEFMDAVSSFLLNR